MMQISSGSSDSSDSPDVLKKPEPPTLENRDDEEKQYVRLILHPVRSTQEAIRLESPRYPEKCKRWKDIGELTCKRALERLLRQGKTPETVAEYLNCSPQQVYRAMKAHKIPTARAYTPALLEHKLKLNLTP